MKWLRRIELSDRPYDRVDAVIEDDGDGFDTERPVADGLGHFGLVGIHERGGAARRDRKDRIVAHWRNQRVREPAAEGLPMLMGKVRVLVVDDHAVVRAGIRAILDGDPRLEVVGEGVDGADGCAQAQTLRPQIVVMDVSMPALNGAEATQIGRAHV